MHSENSPSSSKKASLDISGAQDRKLSHQITAHDFKGIFAPVLTCFNQDEFTTLNLNEIDNYAAWLKREHVQGVCINTIAGEGPALGYTERRLQVETWWTFATKYDLITIAQIGGAPLPDVLQLAEHAEDLGVHAVLCLPELFYKPSTIEELVGYCKIVARKCKSRPFLYYHIPEMTGIYFDMNLFCKLAESSISNFMGLLYAANDLEFGSKCLREGRVVLFGNSYLMAGASLLGFESYVCAFLTVRPDIGRGILTAMGANDLKLAREKQQQLNDIYRFYLNKSGSGQWVEAIKNWFNLEIMFNRGPRFSAGPMRKYFLQKTLNT